MWRRYMAKIIKSEVESRVLSMSYSLWQVILIGVSSGLLYWFFTVSIGKYIIDPFFCNNTLSNFTCMNSVSISGNIASIIIAIASILIMLKVRLSRPLVVAVAVVAALWGLSGWTIGLSVGEIVFWDIIIYVLAYLLFSWIACYMKIMIVLAIMSVVVLMVRIVTNL